MRACAVANNEHPHMGNYGDTHTDCNPSASYTRHENGRLHLRTDHHEAAVHTGTSQIRIK